MEVLHKINTLVREWIKDVSRQKVNFVLQLKALLFSVSLYMHTKSEGIWKLSEYCSFMNDFIEYSQNYKNIQINIAMGGVFLSRRIITLKIKLMLLVEKSAHLVHTDLVFTQKVNKMGH